MSLTVVIAGATGLVGHHCLEALLESDDFARVVALVRRPLERRNPKLEMEVVDFEKLSQHTAWRCDVAFCALGTTIKTAGSQEAFRRVDFDYVREFARWTRAGGAETFVLVSSVGADPLSRNFYLRTKGEAERAVAEIGFRAVHIFRPSMLMGDRREFRLGEIVGTPVFRALSFLMIGRARRYRPVGAVDVAAAMVHAVTGGRSGTHIHHFAEIVACSRG